MTLERVWDEQSQRLHPLWLLGAGGVERMFPFVVTGPACHGHSTCAGGQCA